MGTGRAACCCTIRIAPDRTDSNFPLRFRRNLSNWGYLTSLVLMRQLFGITRIGGWSAGVCWQMRSVVLGGSSSDGSNLADAGRFLLVPVDADPFAIAHGAARQACLFRCRYAPGTPVMMGLVLGTRIAAVCLAGCGTGHLPLLSGLPGVLWPVPPLQSPVGILVCLGVGCDAGGPAGRVG